MAYGCKTTCDNCRPKYVNCPSCGHRNFLIFEKCSKCKTALPQEIKDQAIDEWNKNAETREIRSCFSP